MSAAAPREAAKPPPTLESARRALEAACEALPEGALVTARVEAPLAPVDALSAALIASTSIVWRPPTGPAMSAHGVAAQLTARGPERFAAIERAAEALFLRLEHRGSSQGAPPRLFGGWSFAEGGAETGPWAGFGDARFVLPRWTYENDGHAAHLTLAFEASAAPSPAQLRAELEAVWSALSEPAAPMGPVTTRDVPEPFERERWDAQIEAIQATLAEGALHKVVAARRAHVHASADLRGPAVARALAARHPNAWCFAFRFGAGAFVGATPERLFVKRGRRVETDALAGSIGADVPDAERRLLESDKDQREHAPVVAHLQERLGPLSTALVAPGAPALKRSPDVLHLHTPIRASLREDANAASLAAALHPTPAVGGVPSAEAVEWIDERETHPRGWYAGPVGWMDAAGDAELCVALRCGVVRGRSAWLYAGGGIVRGSTPEAEWEESDLKLRPVRRAIEAGGADPCVR